MNIPKHIFCIWSGYNEMSEDRAKCLDLIQKKSGVTVQLVSPKNLSDWIKPEYPLHETFDCLSLTHKADYLRAYLMHHYGGGYTDIKATGFNWVSYFDLLDQYASMFFIGYREPDPAFIVTDSAEIRENFYNLCGVCHFIFRPNTIFTKTWLDTIHSILDSKQDLLHKYPGSYHPRAVTGGVHGEDDIFKDSQYPLSWNEILAKILHLLMYKHMSSYLSLMPIPKLQYQYR